MIVALPGASVVAILDGSAPGLLGSVTYTVATLDGKTITAPTTVGVNAVTLNGVGTGGYVAKIVAPITPGQYVITWSDGTNGSLDDLIVTPALLTGTTDATYAESGKSFKAEVTALATGLGSTLTVTVVDAASPTPLVEAMTSPVIEVAPGNYQAELPSLPDGSYVLVWNDGTLYYHDPLYVGKTVPRVVVV